jgi:dTDP-4-dehydrorhamnose 3,5-epimerase
MKMNQFSVIDGVQLTKVSSFVDSRGSFLKIKPELEFENNWDSVAISSNPNRGTIRGLHFQVEPFAEAKLITCIQGAIFDVIVDLRPNSKTVGKWCSFELSAENPFHLYLPKGVAHGFQTLLPESILHYCLSSSYSSENSFSIDPLGDLNIGWPINGYSISERDSNGISLSIGLQKYAKSLGR